MSSTSSARATVARAGCERLPGGDLQRSLFRLPLAGISLTMQVKGESKQDLIQDKLDSLELMITDLAILVEDECEPPIFVP